MVLVEKNSIPDYLPQADPFLMVDALLEQNESESISIFVPGEKHLFAENGKFQVAGMLENIAQTAALRSGYAFSQMAIPGGESKEAPVGFIGSIKKLKLFFLPDANVELKTIVSVKHSIGQVNVIEGIVSQFGKEALKCEMNIFLQEQNGGGS